MKSCIVEITKRRSEELRREFKHLMYLKWRTITKYGVGDEVVEARRRMGELRGGTTARTTKRKAGTEGESWNKRSKKSR